MALALCMPAYTGPMQKPYLIHAEWDDEAGVWVATSDDVPGLATESASLEALAEKLHHLVPELLEANGVAMDDAVTYELMARRWGITSRALH
ncbi:DUF1902 domain-containing protein [Diaphorobacter sp. C33]|jgi:predicted RNase H-like HicB family nuclease|uniref:Uncharacterized protein DUF1902 n=2 Tax=Diaphorobacter TaxID=238749 RepID=A0AAX1WQI4_9BURK|nr:MULTISPECIES: DUF1902 domain-containing protein [unclassified Diaphorobacter]ROR39632.1 uncharacterized protein DUF1902 [Diaphorobacter nitroreducens]WKK90533.1 DUF1902 domain-containing protein [Diaphorobacter sp. C33]WOO33202.1 DUF1902 domain-containing protein [Diaphorobacter sp. Y-1]